MNKLMINRSKRRVARNLLTSLLLAFTLLISACDGGIFGTGGADDMLIDGDDLNQPTSGLDSDLGPNEPDDLDSTAGGNTSGDTGGDTGGNPVGETGGETDGNNDPGSNESSGGNPENPQSPSQSVGNGVEGMESDTETSTFANNNETLDSADIRVNIFNATIYSTNASELTSSGKTLLFNSEGIATHALSKTAVLTQGDDIKIEVSESNNNDSLIAAVPSFTASPATFTTLIVRQADRNIDVLHLACSTTTNDANLAKVRIIQATDLGDINKETMFKLQSAGDNPGGIDEAFGPLSYEMALADYKDIPSGDYELLDPLNRISNQALTFEGGNVYTVVLIGESARPLVLINDTSASTDLSSR